MAEKKLFLFNEGVLKIETYPLWMLKLLLVTVLYFSVAATILAHPAQRTDTTPPSWMRHAIIYGIKPSGFTDHSSYDNITAKIPELKELGINTIWLQPVFKTARGGQGYDITDYFSLRDDLGNEQQLKNLISTAHQLHIKVLFDFVPNHTSIRHPFAQDIIKKRKSSPYYDYYQHENDGAPYSSNYHKDSSGFIFYFWKDLINLNYNNPEVRKMITDACKYWIQEFDIDGYRFDAVWAVNARAPEFGKHLRKELKALKPGILMLAEDKGSDSNVYAEGFDAAYDWTSDTNWISHWPWQYRHHARKNFTIFNHPSVDKRYNLIREALFARQPNPERVLRFMENNDVPRFAATHSLAQTKMAAALLFALPGIPLIYNGQETGVKTHPYSRPPIFSSAHSIKEQDSLGLFSLYKKLTALRLKYASLTSANYKELKTEGPAVAFHRWEGNEHLFIVINPDSLAAGVNIQPGIKTAFVRDVLDGTVFTACESNSIKITVEGYGVRWLLAEKKKLKVAR